MWYPITSQQATPFAPPKATPTCCTSVYRCHACLDFQRVLPIFRKSRHLSTTLTNELQHMLLWMVGRRIGCAIIRSRKTKIVCARVYFWRRFSPLLGNSCTIILRPRNLLRATILESRKKSGNSCSCKSATRLVRFSGTNVLKMCGRGFGWGNGRGLVGCDWISHHIPIAFSFPEILHATRVSTTQWLSSP